MLFFVARARVVERFADFFVAFFADFFVDFFVDFLVERFADFFVDRPRVEPLDLAMRVSFKDVSYQSVAIFCQKNGGFRQ